MQLNGMRVGRGEELVETLVDLVFEPGDMPVGVKRVCRSVERLCECTDVSTPPLWRTAFFRILFFYRLDDQPVLRQAENST